MSVLLSDGTYFPTHDPDDPRLVEYRVRPWSFYSEVCMDPVSAGMAAGAGSAFASYMGYKSQKETNEQNAAIAREQMAFQERMSSSAHQREVNDLRAAGLNPILSATGGSGASAPSGASATMQSPGSFIGDAVKDSINTGFSAANMEADLRMKNAGVAKTMADTVNSLETSKVIAEDIRGRQASNALSEATLDNQINQSYSASQRAASESRKARAEASRSEVSLSAEKADLPRSVEQSEINRDMIKYDNIINRVQGAIDTATSALNVSKYVRSPTVKPGTPAEHRALERAGRKGLEIKK